MATILRDWSYRYQWLYDGISRLATLSVGGETRFRQLPLQGLEIQPNDRILDLCCGSGQSTQFLVKVSNQVVGLDASPLSLKRAQKNVPTAEYVEGWAENLPFPDAHFDGVHTSVAMHEMAPEQLRKILQEVYRVLKPGGYFALVDLHAPRYRVLWPGLVLFLWLFETETAWQLIQTDLPELLSTIGFQSVHSQLYAGGSLQVIQAQR
ncbi:MAG: class I SAM-dependent methyltransferase [Leptolyngbyaceae cyanobacterium bins.59]|nr:class I SAM-dependent methyltransferase [Leptolyngbyaceae cyanobacterium bins.59]